MTLDQELDRLEVMLGYEPQKQIDYSDGSRPGMFNNLKLPSLFKKERSETKMESIILSKNTKKKGKRRLDFNVTETQETLDQPTGSQSITSRKEKKLPVKEKKRTNTYNNSLLSFDVLIFIPILLAGVFTENRFLRILGMVGFAYQVSKYVFRI